MDGFDRSDADWRELCEQASKEKDPEKLMELVRKLNQKLEERVSEKADEVLTRRRDKCYRRRDGPCWQPALAERRARQIESLQHL